MRVLIFLFLLIRYGTCQNGVSSSECTKTITTASGTHAPKKICSGSIIFEDDFKFFSFKKWRHDNTLSGGGNWEFQWYTNNRTNSFVKDKRLYIAPTLTKDQFDEEFLTSGTLNLHGGTPADRCTNPTFYGCERSGAPENIINPVKSAQISTVNSFRFKYGKVEVRAKMPSGDWLWPAIWMLPVDNTYGSRPASGDITIVQSRGNKNLILNEVNIGTQQITSGIHLGPYDGSETSDKFIFTKSLPAGYDSEFKNYQVEWTTDHIKFSIDNEEYGKILASNGGFWESAGYNKLDDIENPWKSSAKMAPFDKEFYIGVNLAVGGMNFFPDDAENPDAKPWKNDAPTAMSDFYDKKSDWIQSWELGIPSLQIEHVKVWAL